MNCEYTKSSDSDVFDEYQWETFMKHVGDQSGTSFRRPAQESSQNDKESVLISCVRKCPHLYDVKDPSYKDVTKKERSWAAISGVLDLPSMLCQRRWKSLREKYCRESKHLAETGRVSAKSEQFLKDLNFLSYKKNTGDRSRRRTQTNTRTATPRNRQENRKTDQLFLDVIAEKLQHYSRTEKDEVQANILKVFADFGKR